MAEFNRRIVIQSPDRVIIATIRRASEFGLTDKNVQAQTAINDDNRWWDSHVVHRAINGNVDHVAT
jgi:hypothetical protein